MSVLPGRERVVVVGADAAGMSAAHQALRSARAVGKNIDIVVLEKTFDTSYSACGIPYLVAGLVDSTDDLVARTADKHRAMGVDLRLGSTATAVDLTSRRVTAESEDGHPSTVPFDKLVLATGAAPVIPDWATDQHGRLFGGIRPAKNLDDARFWLDLVALPADGGRARRAVVVGGGYIGVEMAEATLARGFDTTLITRHTVMSSLDAHMSERIVAAMRSAGVQVVTDHVVEAAHTVDGHVRSVTTDDGTDYAADVVVLGLGLRPASELGAGAGLALGEHGGYLPDDRQQVAEGVWAGGDCCEVFDRIRRRTVFAPLGTHANKQGRICGHNLVGEERTFAGILGTAITRFSAAGVHVEIARTGLSTTQAAEAGFDAVSLVTDGVTASGYMPERTPIATNVVADRSSRRLLGMQIVGGHQSGKRIDTAAAALWGEMSVDDLAAMDLSYAPPFATAWEAVQLASRRLADRF
ncbi:MAG TPA: FAD-dependent oxidoreductase [Aldersonia sp.]